MIDKDLSALAAIRKLRDSIVSRLQENENFRVMQVLNRALKQFDEPGLPKVRQLQMQADAAFTMQPNMNYSATPPQAPDMPLARAANTPTKDQSNVAAESVLGPAPATQIEDALIFAKAG